MLTTPQIKASYSGGEVVPTFGSPEYKQAQELARNTATPASTTGVPSPVTGTATDFETPASRAARDYFTSGPGSKMQPVDEQTLRNQALERVRTQVDTINNTYAGLLKEEGVRGTDRLGRTRAVNARSGLGGSDFGNSNLDKTEELNAEKVKALELERVSKINEIFDFVNKDVQTRLQASKDEAAKNTASYQTFLKEQGERATKYIEQLAQSGAAIDSIPPETYKHILEASGYTPEQFKAAFELSKPKTSVIKQEVFGNKLFSITQDPITKKISSTTIDLPFTVPGGYTAEKLTNGQVIFVPKEYDPTRPVSEQVFTFGAPTPTTPKNGTVPASIKVEENNALNWMRLQSDYTPEYEDKFKNDPVLRAKVIDAYKQASPKKTSSSSSSSSGAGP